VTRYLDAFVAHQPNAVFAPAFRHVEDTIDTVGDGLWKEAEAAAVSHDVLIRASMAATLAIVDVNGGPAMVALWRRSSIADHAVSRRWHAQPRRGRDLSISTASNGRSAR
jgi:hypothetical protein